MEVWKYCVTTTHNSNKNVALTLKSHKHVQSWILSCFWDLKGEKSSYKQPIHNIKVFFNKATRLENEWIQFQNSMQSRRFVHGLLAVFLSFLPFNSFFLKQDTVTSGKKTYLCFRSRVRISFPRSSSASKSCVTSLSTTALTMAGRSEASRSSNKTPWTQDVNAQYRICFCKKTGLLNM